MGIDDNYMKKIEEQKRMRAEILRKKAERWKTKDDDDDSSSRSKPSRNEPSRTEPTITRTIHINPHDAGNEQRKSIYINPKAFKGDLSVLNTNLRKINMSVSSASMSNSTTSHSTSSSSGTAPTLHTSVTGSQGKSQAQPSSSTRTVVTGPGDSSPKVRPKKPKTILRVTKNKKGEIIHMEKLLKLH